MEETLIVLYEANQGLVFGAILFLRVFSMVLLGIIIRNVWDDEVSLCVTKSFTGAIFLAVLLSISKDKVSPSVANIISIVTGFGAKNLMEKMIKNEIWKKFFDSEYTEPSKKDD